MAGGGLRDIQNSGYLRVDNYDRLKEKFADAFDLIDRYTRSLYWVYYRSPKTGFQTVDLELRVTCPTCKKGPGGEIPLYATVVESIQTNGFYQVLPGVYINDPVLDDKGMVAQLLDNDNNNRALLGPEKIRIQTDYETLLPNNRIYSLILSNNPDSSIINEANTALLRLHTYVRANDNRYKPDYSITSSNESVVSVIGVVSVTPIESIALIECRKKGTAAIEVIDTANGNLRKTIVVESMIDQ